MSLFKKKPEKTSPKGELRSMAERRRYRRINKNFILSYADLGDPAKKQEITQLKNISLGGMCFITTKELEPNTKLVIELRTPYLSDITNLQGTVLQSHEKVANMIYETRFQFDPLNQKAEYVLSQLITFFLEGDPKSHE